METLRKMGGIYKFQMLGEQKALTMYTNPRLPTQDMSQDIEQRSFQQTIGHFSTQSRNQHVTYYARYSSETWQLSQARVALSGERENDSQLVEQGEYVCLKTDFQVILSDTHKWMIPKAIKNFGQKLRLSDNCKRRNPCKNISNFISKQLRGT